MAEQEVELEGGELAEGLPLYSNFVCSAEGETDLEYAVGILTVEQCESVACIAVADVDGRVLCAIPDPAWHRTKKKRKLPDDAFSRMVSVVVPACAGERDVPEAEFSIKAWLGLLAPGYAPLVLYGPMLIADVGFPINSYGVQKLPYGESLVAVAKDHFTFLSLSEQAGEEAPQELGQRMRVVEEGLLKLQSSLDKLLAPAAPEKPSPHTAFRKRPSGGDQDALRAPPGLDPLVAKHALQAGVSAKALEEVAALGGIPLSRPHQKTSPAPQELTSDEDEEEDLGALEGGSADPIALAVTQMSKVLKEMHRDRRQRKGSTLDGILDRAESGGTKEGLSFSCSKAGAFRALQGLLKSNPTLIYEELERRLQEDWELDGVRPGMTQSAVSARGWVEHRSRIQAFPSSVRAAWSMAAIWDCLRNNKVAEARARAGLALAQIDQQSCERGSWLIASELAMEPPPPLHAFQNHAPPEQWESPHTRLIDPRWFELVLSRLKDLSEFQERKAKLNSSKAKDKEAPPPPPKAEAKKTAKGGAKGGGQKGKQSEPAQQNQAAQSSET